MPTSQAAPNVTALNTVTALSNPYGLLIQYNAWDRGAPFLGKPHPLEVFDLRLVYIPHPFIVTTTCICSPAHAACCVSTPCTCRCHTPCIAMKINVRHVCVYVCVCVNICIHAYSHSHIYHSHTYSHVHVHAHCHVCVCVCVCVFVYGCHILVLSQHHWGFQALSF